MSHSKRNTSLAFFTAHERAELRSTWGSQQARINSDSALPFGSCTLCLLPAKDPVTCSGGPAPASTTASTSSSKSHSTTPRQHAHLFCRECAVLNLLEQKKNLARLARERDNAALQSKAADAKADEEAARQAAEEFDRVQAGLSGARNRRRDDDDAEDDAARSTKKRKIAHDDDGKGGSLMAAVTAASTADQALARQRLDAQRAETQASKSALPAFWVPTRTPDAAKTSGGKSGKTSADAPVCPGSAPGSAHAFSLAGLVSVKFSTGTEANGQGEKGGAPSCAACARALSNATHAVLGAPCGHVVCGSCAVRFIIGEKDDHLDMDSEGGGGVLRCYVCSEPVSEDPTKALATEGLAANEAGKPSKKSKKKDKKERKGLRPALLEISTDGTGFAGGGRSEVKKQGLAFQC